MRRILVLVTVAVCALALPARPASAQESGGCEAQIAATVGPVLQQALQFSPQGYGNSYAPLAQPFAPGAYGLAYGGPPIGPPTPPWVPPPTAMYNASSRFTLGAGQPVFPTAGQILGQLTQTGRFDPTNPDPTTLIGLANLQQTDAARQQQQALLQQQQGLYLNSLYQLSSSYQITALDWVGAYSLLAQALIAYYNRICGGNGGAGVADGLSAPPALPTGLTAPTAPQMPSPPAWRPGAGYWR